MGNPCKWRKPEKPMPEKPETDTTRVPIGWNPSVEDWTETTIEL